MKTQRISQTESISLRILADREFYFQKYLELGQHKFADFLEIPRGSVTHILKRCDFYHKDIKYLRRESKDEGYFKNTVLSEEESYLLGYILGDGCLRAKGRALNLEIASSDLQILNSIIEHFPQFGCESSLGRGCKEIIIYCNALVLRLLNKGLTFSKSVVGCKIDFSGVDRIKFLLGLMDSDGTVHLHKMKNGLVKCNNLEIFGHDSYMVQVEEIFKELGFTPIVRYLVKDRNQPLTSVGLYKQEELKRFYEQAYYNTNLYLKRKHERFHTLIKYLEDRNS